MHASQIQGCVVEQRVEKKRKIAESVWVHNVVTRRGSVLRSKGQMSRSQIHCSDKVYQQSVINIATSE